MKKLIALLLVAVMCLSFVACGESGGSTNDTNNRLDEATLQVKYYHAVNELSRYMNVEVAWNDSNEILMGNEAALYLYNEFKALGNYKDSADYFNRFLVLDNALTKITKKVTDAFGNTKESDYRNYRYNSYGECLSLSELFALIGLNLSSAYSSYTYEYTNDGKIAFINVYLEGSQIFKIALSYNTNGNITEAYYQTGNDSGFTNTYTYDENQRLISADKKTGTVGLGYGYAVSTNGKHIYTYDTNGNLIKESFNGDRAPNLMEMPIPYAQETTYVYDSNGFLIEKSISANGSLQSTSVYTNDENGNIVSEQLTQSGKTDTLIYYYETLYIYQSQN
jgi:hypothetical protein